MKTLLSATYSAALFLCVMTTIQLTGMQHNQKTLICSKCLDELTLKTDFLHQIQKPTENHRDRVQAWAQEQRTCKDCILHAKQQETPFPELRKMLTNKGFTITTPQEDAFKNLLLYFVFTGICYSMLYYKIYPDIKYCLAPGAMLGTVLFIKAFYEIFNTQAK